jgi:FkbM family methyltransferase
MSVDPLLAISASVRLEEISGHHLASVDHIHRDVFVGDEYDLGRLVAEDFVPRVVWDIGGNVGIFSKLAALVWKDSEIHAWEPNPELHPHFVKNTPDRVVLHPKAATGFPGTAVLCLCNEVGGSCMESVVGDSAEQPNAGRVTVQCEVPWDNAPSPDLLKIDCEGGEYYLLQYLPCRPQIILVEMHGPQAAGGVGCAARLRPDYHWEELRHHSIMQRILRGRLRQSV